MKKQSIKNKVKNKNTNRINVINTIKIGNKSNNRKRRNRKSTASGVSSIVVNVPQPLYTPSLNQIQQQPRLNDAPIEIRNPTKPIIDDINRDSINAINEIPNKIVSTIPVKQEEIIVTKSFTKPKSIFNTPDSLPTNVTDNRKERIKNVEFQTPIETPYKTPLQSPPATRSRNVHLNSPLDTTPKVRNPVTGRMVRIGSATYKQMKKQGLI